MVSDIEGETQAVLAKCNYNDQANYGEIDRAYSTNWEKRNACNMQVGKPKKDQ
jgi:hypothetical protein